MALQFTLPKGAVAQPSVSGWWQPTQATFTDEDGNVYLWSSRSHRKGRYPVVMNTPYHRDGFYAPRLAPVWFGYPFMDLSYWVALVFTLGCVSWVVNGHYALFSVRAAVARNEEQAAFVVAVAALIGGTLFEIGSWLLYWEALNQEPDIQTGKHLQHKPLPGAAAASLNGHSSSTAPTIDPESQHDLHISPLSPASYVLRPVGNECPRLLKRRLQAQLQQQPDTLILQPQQQHIIPGSHQPDLQQAAVDGHHAPARLPDTHPLSSSGGSGSTQAADSSSSAPASGPLLKVQATGSVHVTLFGKPGVHLLKAHTNARPGTQQRWVWLGWRPHDLGFTSSFLQLVGATIFWVPCIFGTPGVYAAESLANYGVWNGVFWLFQVVGAFFFIVSACGFMLEEQPSWYRPQPLRIGWQVGFWNLIGAIGFLLSGVFGLYAVPQGVYQIGGTAASTFWGSYAFLIGSYLQLLESVNKQPDSLNWALQLVRSKAPAKGSR